MDFKDGFIPVYGSVDLGSGEITTVPPGAWTPSPAIYKRYKSEMLFRRAAKMRKVTPEQLAAFVERGLYQCATCHEWLPEGSFTRNKKLNKPQNECRDCARIRLANRYVDENGPRVRPRLEPFEPPPLVLELVPGMCHWCAEHSDNLTEIDGSPICPTCLPEAREFAK